jgi:phosphoglycerate dehydrogenase-like enzyme
MPTAERVVLVTINLSSDQLDQLAGISPELRIVHHPIDSFGQAHRALSDALDRDLLARAEVLYTLFAIPRPEQAPNLRWVQLHSAGANQALALPLFQTSVIFTTTSGIHAIPIGEYVLATMLAWHHKLPRLHALQVSRQWPDERTRSRDFMADELRDKTLGIVGYGSIGRHVARLAVGFGMRVLALQRGSDHRDHGFVLPGTGDPEGTLPERYYPPEALRELLGASDVVVIALPLTPATRGLFDASAFAAMRPGAFLVNIARGEICDEAALVAALRDGRLAGAALDVFAREPLPSDDPLWALPNVILTPHISGLTPHYNERATALFAANLRRYLAGEPLYNVVDKHAGY